MNADIDKLFEELFISMSELERKADFARHLLVEENLDYEKIKKACIEVDAQAADVQFLCKIADQSLNLLYMEQQVYGNRI